MPPFLYYPDRLSPELLEAEGKPADGEAPPKTVRWYQEQLDKDDEQRVRDLNAARATSSIPEITLQAHRARAYDFRSWWEYVLYPEPTKPFRPMGELLRDPDACAEAVWEMLALLDRELPEAPHYALAYQAIRLTGQTEDVPKRARLELASELADRAGELRTRLGLAGVRDIGAMAEADAEGVLRLNACFAEYLGSIGKAGRAYADDYLTRMRQRLQAESRQTTIKGAEDPALHWRGWLSPESDTGSTALSAWAMALWQDVVKPKLDRERDKPPALAYAVLEPVLAAHATGNRYVDDGAVLDRYGRQLPIRWERENLSTIASAPATVIEAMVRRGGGLLGRVNGCRALIWEAQEGYRRAIAGEPLPQTIQVPGGFSAFAEAIGAGTTRKARDEVRDILAAQYATQLPWPDGTWGPVLHYRYRRAGGHKKAKLVIILSDQMLPDYVFSIPKTTRTGRLFRSLVPMVGLPPFVGRNNEHGPQAGLSLRVMAELRMGAAELVTRGGVRITDDRMGELADGSGLPARLLPRVLDRWTQDGDDGPAFLTKVESHRYALGPAHADASRFLKEGGEKEIQASKDGKRGVQMRLKRRKRHN